ncbi:ribosome maturation protein [Triangularia verruculosa]|uniref:Ribosome maturation protein n=1 Tax=Triangularia verruculosa TaxID=2587418 RepID=A0AAN6XFE5_9PEZI|nr:ribosome maturation protein [Triangularia verruculosa]
MARGEATRAKVFFKGEHDDFVVIVDSAEDYQKWISDRSIPLAQVVSAFKIFATHGHGPSGRLEGASDALLENEFGTSNEDEAVIKILEKGTLQEFEFPERHGVTNQANTSVGTGR